jgi:hypothetical protein
MSIPISSIGQSNRPIRHERAARTPPSSAIYDVLGRYFNTTEEFEVGPCGRRRIAGPSLMNYGGLMPITKSLDDELCRRLRKTLPPLIAISTGVDDPQKCIGRSRTTIARLL